ncbi:MAG: hypothetical protein ACQKBU_05480 [Verrucomicrobiales bacterium]
MATGTRLPYSAPPASVARTIVDPRTVPGQPSDSLCGLIALYPTLCDLPELEAEKPFSGAPFIPQMDNVDNPSKS